MRVIDLIIELKKMPQDLEVVLDKTNVPEGQDFFVLKGVNAVEEIEVQNVGVCVMLTPFDYNQHEDQFNN